MLLRDSEVLRAIIHRGKKTVLKRYNKQPGTFVIASPEEGTGIVDIGHKPFDFGVMVVAQAAEDGSQREDGPTGESMQGLFYFSPESVVEHMNMHHNMTVETQTEFIWHIIDFETGQLKLARLGHGRGRRFSGFNLISLGCFYGIFCQKIKPFRWYRVSEQFQFIRRPAAQGYPPDFKVNTAVGHIAQEIGLTCFDQLHLNCLLLFLEIALLVFKLAAFG